MCPLPCSWSVTVLPATMNAIAMPYATIPHIDSILPGIRSRAMGYDQGGDWPEEDLRVLAKYGAMRWAAAMPCGGEDLSAIELHFRYEAIASASVSTALILTQRDSAISMIADALDFTPRATLLERLCKNEIFATVGIAQLTTSRRHGEAALRASRVDGGYQLQGVIPWCTGAGRAQYIVAGAVLEDRRQILFVLPTDLAGVRVDDPMPLVALRSTWTAQVVCDDVVVEDKWVLRGPAEAVLGGRSKSLPAGQAFLALGLCRGGLDLIAEHPAEPAGDLHARLSEQLHALRSDLLDASNPAARSDDAAAVAASVRGRANDLALRITHSAVTLYKGSALLADHPAQRLAREALFLLVWSCPSPVVDCTLQMLAEAPASTSSR